MVWTTTILFEIDADPATQVNCDCETVSTYATLATLRERLARRLGYSANATNLPAGMPELLTEFLQDAQRQIYNNPNNFALRTERFYRWTMVPGQRFYGIASSDPACPKVLNEYKVSWVGFEDLNRQWVPLIEGIDPSYYTSLQATTGWPSHYEIRSCIEIFPAPRDAYTLWVKGHFGLEPFTANTDRTTIDDQAVYLLALANAKAHYNKPDAAAVAAQADTYLRGKLAGTHHTARYVPGVRSRPPMTPPRMEPMP